MPDSDWDKLKGAQKSDNPSSKFNIKVSPNCVLKVCARHRATIQSVTNMPEKGFLEAEKGCHPLLRDPFLHRT
jgi:hypothetical protein